MTITEDRSSVKNKIFRFFILFTTIAHDFENFDFRRKKAVRFNLWPDFVE